MSFFKTYQEVNHLHQNFPPKLWKNKKISSFIRQPLHTATGLAQLVERQSAVREVEGSSPRPDQHSGS